MRGHPSNCKITFYPRTQYVVGNVLHITTVKVNLNDMSHVELCFFLEIDYQEIPPRHTTTLMNVYVICT
jgi:hypothetical protein